MALDIPIGLDLLEPFDKALEKVGGLGRARVQGLVGSCGPRWWCDEDRLLAAEGCVANQGLKSDSHESRRAWSTRRL